MPEALALLLAAAGLVGGLLALGLGAACLDGALAARARGLPLRLGARAPLAGAARLARQRRRTTPRADDVLGRTGSSGLLVVAALMAAVVPLGAGAGSALADVGPGVVWVNALDVAAWALLWLAGWGPDAVAPLLGGYRALAQAVAYELPLMVALTAPALGAGSLRLADVAAAQSGLWFVVWMPLAALAWGAGVLAFSLRGPFATPLGGGGGGGLAAGGLLAEASGADRLLLLAGRGALLAAGSLVAVPLFLGGAAALPGTAALGLPAPLVVLAKAVVVLAVLVVVARRLPAVRPERLAEACWVVALPLLLVQLLVVALAVVAGGAGAAGGAGGGGG